MRRGLEKQTELAPIDHLTRSVDQGDVVGPLLRGDDASLESSGLIRISYQQRQLDLRQNGEGPRQADRVGSRADLFGGYVADVVSDPELSGGFEPDRMSRQVSIERVTEGVNSGLSAEERAGREPPGCGPVTMRPGRFGRERSVQ